MEKEIAQQIIRDLNLDSRDLDYLVAQIGAAMEQAVYQAENEGHYSTLVAEAEAQAREDERYKIVHFLNSEFIPKIDTAINPLPHYWVWEAASAIAEKLD